MRTPSDVGIRSPKKMFRVDRDVSPARAILLGRQESRQAEVRVRKRSTVGDCAPGRPSRQPQFLGGESFLAGWLAGGWVADGGPVPRMCAGVGRVISVGAVLIRPSK